MHMKIYFAGSIRGGREDSELYGRIIAVLAKHGEVLTEHIGNGQITEQGEDLPLSEIYERDIRWLDSADVLVAEVTTPSIGVGYEIGRAEAQGKRVLCLYRPDGAKRLVSAMVGGNKNVTVREYRTPEDLEAIGADFFKKL
jgi:nucleoside 2-deoxyribosyltransferase